MVPVRRPGLEQLASRLKLKNPSWSKERCLIEAKQRWTADLAFKRKLSK